MFVLLLYMNGSRTPAKARGLAVGHPVWETGIISARLCKPRLD